MRREVIGDATLYLGDCVEVLSQLPPVHAAITSPPYGEIRDYGGHGPPDMFAVLSALGERLADGGVIMWNEADQVVGGSESGASFRHALHAMDSGLRLHDTMIYCKEGVTFPDSNRYHSGFEYMFVFSKGAPAHFNPINDRVNRWRGTQAHGTKRLASGETADGKSIGFAEPMLADTGRRMNWWVINPSRDGAALGHPAPMPFPMADAYVRTWTVPGETVCDPFMGSGTTGVAAMRLGRRFIGIEIEERYFEIACERISRAHSQPEMFA
jgi:hypothetical protein